MLVTNIARIVDSKTARFLMGVGLVLVLALTLGACGRDSSSGEEPAAEPTATTAPAEPTPTEAAAEAEPTEAPAEGTVTETEGVTETEAMTETEAAPEATEVPEEETVTETEEITGTEGMTETESMTETAAATDTASAGDAAHGQYLVTLQGGCGCHFNSDLGGLAGGRKFEGPADVVYSANLTPDATGIGNLSDQEVIDFIRTGQATVGGETHVLSPIMPYHVFSILSDVDAQDIVAYLRTLEPIENAVPARELTEEPEPFTPAEAPPATTPTDPVAHGQYLVTLAGCGRCHTPTNEDGSPATDMLLAGAPLPDDSGDIAANITPDEATGIGSWSEADIAHFLLTAMEPDGDVIEGTMAQQIERRFSKLTEEDAAAIAAYLKSIPAVSNDPFAK